MSSGFCGAGAWRARPLSVYAASLALTATLACWGAASLFRHAVVAGETFLLADQAARPAAIPVNHRHETSGHVTLTQDWLDRIRSNDFWSGGGGSRGGGGPSQPYTSRSNLSGPSRQEPPSRARFDAVPRFRDSEAVSYRTVCVRQCDGYFWPISFATSETHFKRDRAVCERSCSGAKLYVYRNPGSEPETMRDLDGQPYTKLPAAFLFRTKYEPACQCNAHPWEQAAQDRHRLYALEDQKRQGSKVAAQQVAQLKAQVEQARRAEILQQKKLGPKQQAKNAAAPIAAGPIVSSATVAANPPPGIGAPHAAGNIPAQPQTIVNAAPPQASTAPAGPAPQRPRPAGIMSAGVGSRSNGGGTGGRIPPSPNPSRSAPNWLGQAFRGN